MKKSELKSIIKEVMLNESTYRYRDINSQTFSKMQGLVTTGMEYKFIEAARNVVEDLEEEGFDKSDCVNYLVRILLMKADKI